MSRSRRIRRRVLVVAVALAATLAGAATAAELPDLERLDAGRLPGASLQEGTWILITWASWAPRCRDIVPRVNAIESRWGGRARVATVNFQEDAATARSFLAGQNLRAPVLLDLDARLSKAFAISHLPGLLILQDGVAAFSGRLPRDPDPVIERALSTQP